MATTTEILHKRRDGHIGGGPVNAGKKLLAGTICFWDAVTGGLTDETNSGANKAAGIVRITCDNTGGVLGDLQCDFWKVGDFVLTGSALTVADSKVDLYAVDNNTVSKTATNNSWIGTLARFISATSCEVSLFIKSA